EDFPVVAQREMQAQRAEPQAQQEEDRGPMSLLRRLAHVGLGRRAEEAAPQANRQQPAPQQRAPQQGSPQQPIRQPQAPQAGYAAAPRQPQQAQPPRAPQQQQDYRPRQAELDQHGRVMPRNEDDQLEIPAFLRRQAN
ncbi:MAG: cell division protein FtsZ, partial [Rhizobiales bacterium]|nr:cell division protein FtsZ [Hyphomicrobiales bacterium]